MRCCFLATYLLLLSLPSLAQPALPASDPARTPVHKQAAALNDLSEIWLSREPARAADYARQAQERAQNPHNPAEEIRAQINLGEACLPQGKFADALSLGEKSVRQAMQARNHSLQIRALNLTGKAYRFQGNRDKAVALHQQARELSESVGDKFNLAESLSQLAIVHRSQNELPKALDFQQQALTLREAIRDKRGLAQSLNSLGVIHRHMANPDKAQEAYRRALKIYEELDDKIGQSNVLNNIGLIHHSQGENADAIKNFLHCLKIKEEIGGKAGIITVLNNISAIYLDLREYEKSLEYSTRSLRLSEEIGNQRAVADSLINAGSAYDNLREYSKALEAYQRALKIWEEVGEKRMIPTALNNLGLTFQRMKNYDKAQEYQLRAVRLWEENGSREGLASSLTNLATIHRETQQPAQALEYLQRAMKAAEEARTSSTLTQNVQRNVYGEFYLTYEAAKDYQHALEYYRRYVELDKKISGEGTARRVTELEKRAEWEARERAFKVKEKEVELLQRDRQIQELALARQRDNIRHLEHEHQLRELSLESNEQKLTLLQNEQQIRELELSRSSARSEQQERQIALLTKDAELQASIRKTLIFGLCAVVALLGLLLNSYLIKRRSERSLQEKNEEITRQKELLEQQACDIERVNHELKQAALTDPLTGLRNRRFYQLVIDKELARAERAIYRHAASDQERAPNQDVIFYVLDVDHFKRVNDQYGHEAGDEVLVEVARRLVHASRESDFVLRWGGEEFLIVARETDRNSAEVLTQRLLKSIGGQPFILKNGVQVSITMSVGWALYDSALQAPGKSKQEAVIQLADRAVYLAKEAGRNQAIGLLITDGTAVAKADLYLENDITFRKIYTPGPQPAASASATKG